MPQSVASPPLAPVGFDVDVYVVLDDFGTLGRSYRETAEEGADRESLVRDSWAVSTTTQRGSCVSTRRKAHHETQPWRSHKRFRIA